MDPYYLVQPWADPFGIVLHRYNASQADVAVYKALPSAPDAATYPHSARWYSHIQSYEAEHVTLPGDASKDASAYGPSTSAAAVEPVAVTEAKAVEEDEDDIDLFGSSDEEVDEEAEALKQKRLAEYAAKKAKKEPTVGKSVVTLDVKPCEFSLLCLVDELPTDLLLRATRGR